MKHHTVLLRLFHAKPLPHTVNGGARWSFVARTADGSMLEFKTASDVGAAYETNLSRIKVGSVIRATYHETRSGTLMASHWEDGRAAGKDLTAEFDALDLRCQIQADVCQPQCNQPTVRL
jgi:hypothetical protein